MTLISHAVVASGLVIETDHGRIALTPYSARTLRVRHTLAPDFSSAASLAVTATPDAGIAWEVEERPDSLLLRLPLISVEVSRRTAALTWRDAQGGLLTREPERGGRTLEPVDVVVSVFDEATTVESRENVDGVRIDAVNVRQVVDRRACHAKLEFEWAHDEAIYGLGSHEEGMFNLRGQHQYLYQQNMKAVMPVLVSTRGYGVMVDCPSLMTFHDDAFGSYLWCDLVAELDYYMVAGPELDDIVAGLRALTGAAPLLPRWSFGYVQSKERYQTQDEVLEVVREHRRRELPLDVIVLDWKHWTGEQWGQKSFDPDRFPDPDAMAAEIHALDARLMISIWPIMRPGGDNWRELDAAGLLLGNHATYNAFDPDARAMYWAQARRGLFEHGVDAWWSDCTEPFESDWKGAVKPEPEERLRINTEESKRYLDPALINAYSLLHCRGMYEGQRSVTESKRVLNLTRSAWLGQQRYGAVTWSGDVAATWETLRRQIAEGLSFCMTGMPWWTTDVGAFFVKRRPDLWFWAGDFDGGVSDLGYRELYVRWFQFGAFLPMFRAHGTDIAREVWQFGEPGEPFYEALGAALRLRYRLLPYIYSLAGWTTHRAYTMLRALLFDFRADPSTHAVADQFMLGPSLMVCPVTRPMAWGPGSEPIVDPDRTRPVYLPAGADWFDFWTGDRHPGGATVVVDAPLDHLPLFVRAGAIVPMGPVRQHVGDLPGAPLELHVWPGADAQFTIYDDEGDGYGYEAGAFATFEVRWEDAARRFVVGARTGGWPGMPAEQEMVVVLHVPGVRPDALPTRRLCYAAEPMVVDL